MCYIIIVKKKAARRQKNKNSYMIPLFWVAFVAVIVLLFVINLPKIRETVNATPLGERITGLPPTVDEGAVDGESAVQIAPEIQEKDYPSLEEALAHLNDVIGKEENRAAGENAVSGTSAGGDADADVRERTVYFMRVDADGVLVRTGEKRQMKNTSSPLGDTMNVLLGGLTMAEKARGIMTLIPEGTVLINAAMRGSTAVLNFNENFKFNSYGAEGYIAQLRQIVWTATEFPSVRNVQFLVEGQRTNYLGDNIPLDQPISREDLGVM
ncbi:MAG: GerMN domain-containing protein [Spirochaetaceae bacterium]|nr:GerMN domain-containing protein [Spirochaetaceae bacterium]